MLNLIQTTASKYGWSAIEENGAIKLFNREGNHTCTVTEKKGRYLFSDTAGNKILSGSGLIEQATERVLTKYYYCNEITR